MNNVAQAKLCHICFVSPLFTIIATIIYLDSITPRVFLKL